MGFPDAIGTEGCAILYAGDIDAFDRCTEAVEAFGGTAMMVGYPERRNLSTSGSVLLITAPD